MKFYCTDFSWCKWDLKLQSSDQQCSTFKAAVTQEVSKALGIEYHTVPGDPNLWERLKKKKANDIIKRLLHKLTQETQDDWFKVLPIALMRAQTAPKKGLSLWQTVFVHRYCHRPWSLRINYVTQLSAFQPPHQLKASHGGFLHFKERAFFSSATTFTNKNHMWHLFLMTSNNSQMDWCNYGHNVTFKLS